jgi:hypothetical protein
LATTYAQIEHERHRWNSMRQRALEVRLGKITLQPKLEAFLEYALMVLTGQESSPNSLSETEVRYLFARGLERARSLRYTHLADNMERRENRTRPAEQTPDLWHPAEVLPNILQVEGRLIEVQSRRQGRTRQQVTPTRNLTTQDLQAALALLRQRWRTFTSDEFSAYLYSNIGENLRRPVFSDLIKFLHDVGIEVIRDARITGAEAVVLLRLTAQRLGQLNIFDLERLALRQYGIASEHQQAVQVKNQRATKMRVVRFRKKEDRDPDLLDEIIKDCEDSDE